MAATSETLRVPVQDRSKRTVAAILDAAQIEFSRNGYARTTAKSIAARAGVAVGSVYVYFKDKDAILRSLALERFEAIGSRVVETLPAPSADRSSGMAEEARRRMRAVVEAVADYHRDDPGLHAVLTERRHCDPDLDAMTEQAEHMLQDQLAYLLRSWGFAGDSDATAFVLFGMVEGAIHGHVLGGRRLDDDRVYDALVESLLAVIVPRIHETPQNTNDRSFLPQGDRK